MTADLIKAFLQQANAERPDLAQTNTNASAFELLALTLAKAGPDWAFVGKSTGNAMDGAGVRPAWFHTITMSLTRPDGQQQSVNIDALSQDAAWHIPSHRQVKVIANSAANEPGDWAHGPAHLDPYDIDPVNYRWHNPPVAQPGAVSQPVPPSGHKGYPGDPVWDAVGEQIFADYASANKNRPDDPSTKPNPQMARWFGRTIWDATEGDGTRVLTVDESIKKHRNEWLAALGITLT